ncbi:MAG: ATP-binding protein [Bacteroidales bacterium]|nr:ATP-binding protein [Bacteroidales bacterium]
MNEDKDLFVISEYFRQIYENYEIKTEAERIFAETGDVEKVNEYCKKYVLKQRADKYLAKSMIDKRFKTRTFDTFKPYNEITKKAKAAAIDYAENIHDHLNTGKNLIIAGSGCVGTGKTHLACAVAQRVMELGVPAKFINVVSMISEIKENFSVKNFTDIELLIIDDLGKENGTDWVKETVYSIINKRYEKMLPTVITTEKTIEAMTSHYEDKGKAILSRICESFRFIELNGEDYRRRRE